MTALWVALAVAALLALWVGLSYNRLVRLRNEAHQAFSGIELQLKRRADLVPALLGVVEGYAAHERNTLESVTAARQAAASAGTPAAAAAADMLMQGALIGMAGVAEAYPELRASASFRELATQLVETEDRLAGARQYYNAVVQRYNTLIQQLPVNFVATLFDFKAREFYEVDRESDRSPVAVRFEQLAVAA